MSLLSPAVPRALVALVVAVGAFALVGADPAAAQALASSSGAGTGAVSGGAHASDETTTGRPEAPMGADDDDTVAAAPIATRPVAARDLERGEVLTAADIRYVAASGEQATHAPASLVGWRTRRLIDEGEPLREPAVSPPDLVRAGETVQAVYRGRSIVLRVTGTAAGSGAMGERVLVRVDARRRLEGVVIGPALVELDTNESR